MSSATAKPPRAVTRRQLLAGPEGERYRNLYTHEVTAPARFATPRRWVYVGRCYEKALEFVLRNEGDDIRLIHGTARGPDGTPVEHAWVAVGTDLMFEATIQAFFPAEVFASLFGAVAQRTYTRLETSRMVIQHNHNGPWEQSAGSPGNGRSLTRNTERE